MAIEAQSAREPGTGQITHLLTKMRQGDPRAEEELLSRVYPELHALAASMMAREAPGHTLQPTALLDEAWMRLFGRAMPHCPDRAYLFAAVGNAMRRILVEHARRKKRGKRWGNQERVDIESVEPVAPQPEDELLAVDEAVERLAECDPEAARLVDLCYFVGLTQPQAAKELGVSLAKVERTLAFARAWLFRDIERTRNALK